MNGDREKNGNWRIRKEVSIGTIVTIGIVVVAGIGGYIDLRALAQGNAKQIDGQPERLARLEERIAALQREQHALSQEVQEAAEESREADEMTINTLNAIAIAIARLEQQIADR